MKKLIVIADWASDSMNFQEFRSAVEGFIKEADGININFITSTPSTIHTGYILGQIVETEERLGRPMETIIFQNTDTRLNQKGKAKEAQGEDFLIILLKSGLYICGPNSGYNFSFIKEKIDEVFKYKGLDKGSQFRSRDLYARVSAHLMDEQEDEMELEETHTSAIPEVDGYFVGHVDNHGNIKTNIKLSELRERHEFRDEISVTINNITRKAEFVNNLFGGEPGQLVIYPGSSGKFHDSYLEVSIWRYFTEDNPTTGSAEFNYPKPGTKVEIK